MAGRGGRIVGAVAAPLLGGGLLVAFAPPGDDPYEDVRAFLTPYTPIRRYSGDELLREERTDLQRPAYLREEDARLVRALPRAHGWRFSRTTSEQPYRLTATATRLSRTDRLAALFPPLARWFPVRPSTITVVVIGYKETRGDAEPYRLIVSGAGWTNVAIQTLGSPLGIDAPVSKPGVIEITGTPSAPGRARGE